MPTYRVNPAAKGRPPYESYMRRQVDRINESGYRYSQATGPIRLVLDSYNRMYSIEYDHKDGGIGIMNTLSGPAMYDFINGLSFGIEEFEEDVEGLVVSKLPKCPHCGEVGAHGGTPDAYHSS